MAIELTYKPSLEVIEQVSKIDSVYMDYPWSHTQWLEWHKKAQDGQFLLALSYLADDLTGFALIELSSGEWAHLLKIAITDKHKRKGLAQLLLRDCITEIKERSPVITLEVRDNNQSAIGLYEKLGFKTVKRVKSFYSDGQNAFKMIAELH